MELIPPNTSPAQLEQLGANLSQNEEYKLVAGEILAALPTQQRLHVNLGAYKASAALSKDRALYAAAYHSDLFELHPTAFNAHCAQTALSRAVEKGYLPESSLHALSTKKLSAQNRRAILSARYYAHAGSSNTPRRLGISLAYQLEHFRHLPNLKNAIALSSAASQSYAEKQITPEHFASINTMLGCCGQELVQGSLTEYEGRKKALMGTIQKCLNEAHYTHKQLPQNHGVTRGCFNKATLKRTIKDTGIEISA